MERFAKYRDQIRHMPDAKFAKKNAKVSDGDPLIEGPSPDVDAFLGEEGDDKRSDGPYALYAKRRRTILLVKLIVVALAVAGFVVWWFLLQGRK